MFRYNPLTHKNVRLKHNLASWTQWAASDIRVKGDLIDSKLSEYGISALEPPPERGHFISSRSRVTPEYLGNVFGDEVSSGHLTVHNTTEDGLLEWQEAIAKFGSYPDQVHKKNCLWSAPNVVSF